jgi:lauroyl/myristoyl acyltransferase
MDLLLSYIARWLFALLRLLPLGGVARVGRFLGATVYVCDARHRRVAIRNITMCLGGEKSPEEIRALAKENFRRIGENFACAVKTASMDIEELRGHLEMTGDEQARAAHGNQPASMIVAIGHFGNFEIYARAMNLVPGYRGATTYRALRGEAINRLLQELRDKSGCRFFERRTDGAALRAALRNEKLVLGLLSDQHSGDSGVRIPFFGQECSTTKAPAVFAQRFNLKLYTAICFRTRPGHWRVEVGEEIPTCQDGQPRATEDIMLDVNHAFEAAVRRDPANWFWVHNRWKPRKRKKAAPEQPPVEELALEAGGTEEPGGGAK